MNYYGQHPTIKLSRGYSYFLCGAFLFLGLNGFSSASKAEKISVGNHEVDVTLAQTRQEQMKGLQGVSYLAEDHGMLFSFVPARKVCFWMKNTPIDLDVGFFNEKLELVQIEKMQANMLDLHCSKQPIRFALEVNRDWFTHHRISLGEKLTLPKTSFSARLQ